MFIIFSNDLNKEFQTRRIVTRKKKIYFLLVFENNLMVVKNLKQKNFARKCVEGGFKHLRGKLRLWKMQNIVTSFVNRIKGNKTESKTSLKTRKLSSN